MLLQKNDTPAIAARRIISMVPSITELLHYFNLEEETIGITKFCVHPSQWFRSKPRVGGTKTVNIAAIQKLQPDLVIANKEENVKDQVEELAKEFTVLLTDVDTVEEALQMIQQVGDCCGKTSAAMQLVSDIQKAFAGIPVSVKPVNTAYLIWNKPYMAAGGGTFINDMLLKAGMQNVFSHKERYPEVTAAQIQEAGCELLLLSSEPYPFKQKHIDELQPLLPGTKILLADGEMFSWYGNRMLHFPEYLKALRRE
ncbi:helical backbone metal receptor [Ferruginibacter sp.]